MELEQVQLDGALAGALTGFHLCCCPLHQLHKTFSQELHSAAVPSSCMQQPHAAASVRGFGQQ